MNQVTKFELPDKEELAAMNTLKDELASSQELALLTYTEHVTLDTDARENQVGSVLM